MKQIILVLAMLVAWAFPMEVQEGQATACADISASSDGCQGEPVGRIFLKCPTTKG